MPNRNACWNSPTAASPEKYDNSTVPSCSDSAALSAYKANGEDCTTIRHASPGLGRAQETPTTRAYSTTHTTRYASRAARKHRARLTGEGASHSTSACDTNSTPYSTMQLSVSQSNRCSP